jgi:RNA polymerase sigma-70 factor, ECF subfamily
VDRAGNRGYIYHMEKTTQRRYATAATRPTGARTRGVRDAGAGTAPVPLSELSDEKLFELYQGGNEAAFTLIVKRYQPLISGFLHKRLTDQERVQDLTQDTFLRVHRARDRYDSRRKFSTWIYTIASNLLKNEYRNRARRRETTFSEMSKKTGTSTAPRPVEFESETPDPEQVTYAAELRMAIDEAIDQLDEHHRVPFVMREVEDRTYEEISEAIGVPIGTVKSRLFRARTAFQTVFPVPV